MPHVSYLTRGIAQSQQEIESLYSRYLVVPGTNQASLQSATVALIGAGGLNSDAGMALARKGAGRLIVMDHDEVELSNLPRQQYTVADLGKNKALCLAKHMREVATGRTLIEGYGVAFQPAADGGFIPQADVVIVGVDNNPARLAAADEYFHMGVPVVFLGVDTNASRGYVFVQESRPGKACFRCLYPEAEQDTATHGCAGASVEILKITVGIALYAVDSLLMARPRPWNMKTVFLDMAGDGARTVACRADCPLCGERAD